MLCPTPTRLERAMCSEGDGVVLQSGSHLKHFALWEGEGRDIQLVSHARSGDQHHTRVSCALRFDVLHGAVGCACTQGIKKSFMSLCCVCFRENRHVTHLIQAVQVMAVWIRRHDGTWRGRACPRERRWVWVPWPQSRPCSVRLRSEFRFTCCSCCMARRVEGDVTKVAERA
jgi:hypothetical protein